ncbi:CbtA family protein [Actimicrobium sp. CCC2.4]|uniref:CbtA family protein n=1 Tax=Actimicrobium sp. CCC2.4 TaxID=3048606 RepID=UPI002AC9E347|nr:CbtA family protein [Actimicrobium sp. CCC2.4]MEB0136840.1 CbtA family protein [Actimicrobium sp. CCC2.4]WPX33885.1 CbtA family protein [Actimicrobium sp. CCC2.4]
MSLKSAGPAGNWHAIKQIISAAALAGLTAGVCLTAVQQWQVVPLIHQAEVLEQAASQAHTHTQTQLHTHTQADGHTFTHSHSQADALAQPHAHSTIVDSTLITAEHSHGHQHEAAANDGNAETHAESTQWQPADGFERLFYTTLANVSLAVGFALLLGSVLYLRGSKTNWRAGLAWGLAGYVVFYVAPSIGLPPELPGADAAPLAARQFWWVLTVASVAAGLALLRFGPLPLKLAGALFLVLPYLVGAPHLSTTTGDVLSHLTQPFVLATALANGVFWLMLGALTAAFYKKKYVDDVAFASPRNDHFRKSA